MGCGLIVFVLSFGIFSYYMEAKCEYYIESGYEYLARYSTVIRDGVPRRVRQEHLVVGDLICFRQGDEICVDLKLTHVSSGVHINADYLAEKEAHYYELLYCGEKIGERFFHVGDIILRNSFILSGKNCTTFSFFIFLISRPWQRDCYKNQ